MDDKGLFSNLEEFPSPEELFRMDAEPEEELASPGETKESATDGESEETADTQSSGSRRNHKGAKIFLVMLVILLLAAAVFVFYLEKFHAGGLQFVTQWF